MATASATAREVFTDDFAGTALDTDVWLPHYLPAWSSRAASRASQRVADGVLVLDVPPDHPVWCAGDHEPPLRVSGLQTGNRSGPVGSADGQQPFRAGIVVREEQPPFEGLLVDGGRLEVRCRMELTATSMASLWAVGFEDRPERCGELCVLEVFGSSLRPGSAEVGMGVHAFRDPDLVEDFDAHRRELDVAQWHDYAVTWDGSTTAWEIDGTQVRRGGRAPAYPLQLMLAVFDFPGAGAPAGVPRLEVDRVSWTRAPRRS